MLNKRILTLVSLLLISFLLVGCWPIPIVDNQAPIITSEPGDTATVGEAYTYDVNATDPDGDALTYSLITYPSGMKIVEYTGLITWTPDTVGNFDVTVMVSDGLESPTQSFTITVTPVVVTVTGVTLNQSTMTLRAGGATGILEATVTPPNATDKSVIWSSSAPAVATVADGVVTSLIVGTAVITVTTVDGDFTATCTVTVSKPMEMTVILPTFRVGGPYWFTVDMVANGDLGKSVVASFEWPKSTEEVKIAGTLETDETSDVAFTQTGDVFQTEEFTMEDATANFRGTFTSAGTYSTTIEVKTTGGILLCSKDITIVVEAASDDATLKSLTVTVDGEVVELIYPGVFGYNVVLGAGTATLVVDAEATHPEADVVINQAEIPAPGKHTLATVVVTAKDGNEETYKISFTIAGY